MRGWVKKNSSATRDREPLLFIPSVLQSFFHHFISVERVRVSERESVCVTRERAVPSIQTKKRHFLLRRSFFLFSSVSLHHQPFPPCRTTWNRSMPIPAKTRVRGCRGEREAAQNPVQHFFGHSTRSGGDRATPHPPRPHTHTASSMWDQHVCGRACGSGARLGRERRGGPLRRIIAKGRRCVSFSVCSAASDPWPPRSADKTRALRSLTVTGGLREQREAPYKKHRQPSPSSPPLPQSRRRRPPARRRGRRPRPRGSHPSPPRHPGGAALGLCGHAPPRRARARALPASPPVSI